MPLSVKHKVLLLLVGTLVAAFALVAGVLGWLIGAHHSTLAGHATHALLRDLSTQLTERHRGIAADTQALAGRADIAATLALLHDYATPLHYQPQIFDDEKKKLLAELRKYTEINGISELGVYDGDGILIAFERRDLGDQRRIVAGISTWEDGLRHWSGPGAHPQQPWRRIELPADMPEQLSAFGLSTTALSQLRRHQRHLALEAIAPITRQRDGRPRRVGWLRLSHAVTPAALDALARPRNMTADLLFSGDFDRHNRFGLRAEQFKGAKPIQDVLSGQRAEAALAHPDFYLESAMLTLAGGEQAWFVAAQARAATQSERQRTLGVLLAVLAGSLLVAVPGAGWAGRRWLSAPFDKLRAGVHEYTQGRLETHIDLHNGDEFDALAEDINILAVALRVREIAIKEAEERWQFALDGAGHGVWDWNPQSDTVFFSPAWKRMLGYREDEVDDSLDAWRKLVHPDDLPAVQEAIKRHLRGETPSYQASYRILAKEGGYRWVLAIGRVVRRAADGQAQRMIGTHTDITARVEAESDIREAATVFDATTEAIMITDVAGVIKRVNPAFAATTGYTAEEVVGQTPRLLKSGRHDAHYYAEMWDSLQVTGRWEGEVWNRRKNGEIFPEWQIISTVRDAAGRPIEFVSLFIDITQRKRSEAEIAYRANYDALTGLPNRNLLTERLGQALKQARRESTRVAVMFVDLDFFKQVNDTLGHAVGDRLLQVVAERMRLCVRETDTIARQGGDEFVVLLSDIADNADAAVVAEKIIGQAGAPFEFDGNEIHIGASVGITLFPDDGRDIETLFRNADLAMYRAKDAGRNNAQFFEQAMTTAALERRALEADLRGALLRNEFALHYQPVIDLASGRIVGAEALLRWQHPLRGEVGPAQFIPLAEETGLIREIGAWVFDAGCRQLAAWHAAGHRLTLALNVSVRQLPDALSVAHILTTLARHGLAPRQIVLEITEGVLLADSAPIQEWFVAAGASGLQLAIDDFGTGYSSLAYLKRYPVHHVKIDQGFVRDMASNPADRALVDAILAMAHSLGLSVVAEGVETAEQASLLQARACEQAQGYLYSRAVPAAIFDTLLGAAKPR